MLSRLRKKPIEWSQVAKRFLCAPRKELRKTLLVNEEDRKRFESVFPVVVSSLTTGGDHQLQPAMDHFKNVLEYNVPNGKKQRGMLTLAAYRILTEQPTEQQLFEACIAGWSLEMLQAASLVADDVMDQSAMRRGQVCWYLKENVGIPNTINDIYFLENGVYQLIQKYLRHQLFYVNLMELVQNIAFQTICGQRLDLFFSKSPLDSFTLENYVAICQQKTALYSFYLPVATAMHMAGANEIGQLAIAKDILLKIGLLFQMQDDYLDCFGESNKTGKIGSDIAEGKCTWLIVKAIELLDDENVTTLKNWYGKDDPYFVKKVVDKFIELKLDELYLRSSDDLFNSITNTIEQLPTYSVPPHLFHLCLQSLYDRQA